MNDLLAELTRIEASEMAGSLTVDEWCDYWLSEKEHWKGDNFEVGDALDDLKAAATTIRQFTALIAALTATGEREARLDTVETQFRATDNALANISGYADAAMENFDEQGNIKGDGKWRLAEIAKFFRMVQREFDAVVIIHRAAAPPAALAPAGQQ